MCSLRSLRSIFLGSGIIDRSDRAREHAPSETDVRDCLVFQVVYRSRRCDRFPMMHSPQEQLPVCGSGGSNKLLVLCIGGFWVSVMKILIFYHLSAVFHNSILIITVIAIITPRSPERGVVSSFIIFFQQRRIKLNFQRWIA